MAEIPLNLKLKRKAQKEIAYAQDIIVEGIYSFFSEAVIHGGTAIWRCYNGNRFSEDVDVYIPKDKEKIEGFFSSLEKKGFRIMKKRVKENSLYSEMAFNGAKTRFEATFQVKKPFLRKYETSESFFINVYTLTPEDLIIEKVETYLKRRKIRDLYDIFFLLSYAEKNKDVKKHLIRLIKQFTKPEDKENLNAIVISGAVPSAEQLIEGIKKWAK